MTIKSAVAVFVLVACLGCTHTKTVHTDTARFEALQRNVTDERVTVTLVDQQYYRDVRLMRLTPHRTSWRMDDGQRMSVPTSSVHSISVVNRSRGQWEGFGLGLMAGALTGAFIGFGMGDDPEDQFFAFTAEDKAMAFAIPVGLLGGLTGVAVGGASGSTQTYYIAPAPLPPPRADRSPGAASSCSGASLSPHRPKTPR